MKTLLTMLTACGMISARAAIIQYSAFLDGPTEPTASPGIGNATVNYDNVNHLLQLQVTFGGLVLTGSGTSSSHIHLPTTVPFTGTAGVVVTPSTLPGFPVGVRSGSYSNTLDMTQASTYPAAFITANGGTTAGAEAAVISAFNAGKAYWNIHSGTFGGGEIRGFIVPVIRIINMQISSNLTITSTLASTNNRTFTPEYNTNLFGTNWTALTVLSNKFVNGTNEIYCGKPAANAAFLRIRAQVN